MKYFILAGEKSGDLHGSNLVKEIHLIDKKAEIIGWGGDQMTSAGVEILVHHQELAIMGILGVLKNLFRLNKLFNLFTAQILEFQPDTIIFIDYGGFNLKAAKIANQNGFYTQFYIAPKVWAWNTKRALKIKRIIDHLYVIFPFEVDFYKQFNYKVHYVGNPLVDAIEAFIPDLNFSTKNNLGNKPILVLLPGSRKQEINSILPLMLDSIESYKDNFTIALAVAPITT